MDRKELASGVDPETHWYYQTKKLPLLRYFNEVGKTGDPISIFDIGAGSGFFSECLIRSNPGRILDVVRVDTGYAGQEIREHPQICGRLVTQRDLPESISNSLVLLMDVLEHVQDDRAFLRTITERCAGTNHFFITVPAFQSLWSGHDVYLGHYRRYRLRQIMDLTASLGIESTAAYYVYALIFPALWFVRRVMTGPKNPGSNMKPIGGFSNAILKWLCGLELSYCRSNAAFGVTCVLEGRRAS